MNHFRIHPRGAAHPFAFVFGVSLIAAGMLIGLLCWDSSSSAVASGGGEPLKFFCGASLRTAVDAVIQDYKKEYGVDVQVQYDASDNLLTSLELTHSGDLFLPAEVMYIKKAKDKGLARELLPLGSTHPTIVVKKGNPKHISSVADLLKPDTSMALASPSAAIGRLTKELLENTGEWEALHNRLQHEGSKISELGKEPEVANAVKLGVVDAGIIWEASVTRYPELESVPMAPFSSSEQPLGVAVLESSKSPARALHFARYLAASDKGLLQFKKFGYSVVEGDVWEDQPQLLFFAGAMLRPAIETTLKEFEAREGIPHITTVYNGCGILVGQMKTKERPDIYFSCDKSFMDQVRGLFNSPEAISTNKMVIVTKKGNPQGIHGVRDLIRPGLRLGVGDEKQCALGWLTHNALDRAKLCEGVEKNIVARFTTGDHLISEIRAGPLDAVIVYESNTQFVKDSLDVIPMDLDQNIATQPVAVGRNTRHRYLAERLLDAIHSPLSEQRFKQNGFQWIAQPR